MLETETPEAIPQRRRSSFGQTYSDNLPGPDRPQFNPRASNPVLNLLRDHAPLCVLPFSFASKVVSFTPGFSPVARQRISSETV